MTDGTTKPTPPTGRELLAGKVVLVTAAAGTGIGNATARRCLEEGATVVLSDAHERRLGEAADELTALAGGARPATLVCDVTEEEQVQAMVDGAVAAHGRLDVVVNNAGLGGTADARRHDRRAVAARCSTSRSPAPCAACGRRCATCTTAGGGVIVNNASVLGWRAQAGQAHYAAAKAGVMALTRCAAIEAAPHGRAHQRRGADRWPCTRSSPR